MGKRISIQGYEGSFHQMAAWRYFGKSAEVIPCASFGELVRTTAEDDGCDAGIMAIENSIAGSILANYNLLQQSKLVVTGEVYLRIAQQLLVYPGVQLGDITEVHSHTMALQQCADFLDRQHWKLVETEDTALSAKSLRQHKSRHIAAVAGKLAAELFELDILVPDIHTVRQNYTRFLILERPEKVLPPKHPDKASVSFQIAHAKGTLAGVLEVIARNEINLTKLQSFPIPGSRFKYNFHTDMEFDDIAQCNLALKELRPLTEQVRVFGVYKRGRTWK